MVRGAINSAGRGRGGFSLIELLVVVSIIALLIALLLPSLTKVKEAARRSVCASNMRQIFIGTLDYASTFNGQFPDNVRDDGGEHLTFIHTRTYEHFTQTMGLIKPVLSCPNRSDWYRYETAGVRLGYYFMFGHTAPWSGDPNPWTSPRQMTAPGQSVMIADVIEKRTANPNVTSSSHGPTGEVRGPLGQPLEPEQIDSEGGNVGRLDGSVTWEPQAAKREHRVNHPGTISGYW